MSKKSSFIAFRRLKDDKIVGDPNSGHVCEGRRYVEVLGERLRSDLVRLGVEKMMSPAMEDKELLAKVLSDGLKRGLENEYPTIKSHCVEFERKLPELEDIKSLSEVRRKNFLPIAIFRKTAMK